MVSGVERRRAQKRRDRKRRKQSTSEEGDYTSAAHTTSGTSSAPQSTTSASSQSAGIGGAMSAVFNNPIDVVKSRIQSRSGPAGGLSMAQCLRETVAEGGLRALGGGLQARAFRLFLSQGIQFSVVDRVGRLLR